MSLSPAKSPSVATPSVATQPVVTLRRATTADASLLAAWDREPHVIACSGDDPDMERAFGGLDWAEEIAAASDVSFHLIAEADGLPIGAMQVCDPYLEPTHYWGEIEPGLWAIDIWIGPADALNQGLGSRMMRLAIDDAFTRPGVTAIVIDPLNSNTAAHRFYARLGFRAVGRRMFDDDDCLVHRLERADWIAMREVA